jgi:hypothetical protein
VAIGVIVLICLIIGLISAISSQNTIPAILFGISVFGLVVFLWLNLNHWKRLAIGEEHRHLSWNVDLPESQRVKLNEEVSELAKILEIPAEQMSDLLSAYIVAEDLALRQIQQEAHLPLIRHVQVGSTPFDAVLVKNDLITCIEVTFLVTPNISQEKINQILQKVSAPMKSLRNLKTKARLRLLLVLVTQLDKEQENQLRNLIVDRFKNSSTPVDVDIRLLDFEELQKTYAVE